MRPAALIAVVAAAAIAIPASAVASNTGDTVRYTSTNAASTMSPRIGCSGTATSRCPSPEGTLTAQGVFAENPHRARSGTAGRSPAEPAATAPAPAS